MTKVEFVDKFLFIFAKSLSPKEKRMHNIGSGRRDFLWNLFAAKLVPCFEGDEARRLYDSVDKTGAIEIFYSGCNRFFIDDDKTSDLKIEHLTSANIDKVGVIEFYVIDKDFKWCYVITHENMCGPYFCFSN